MNDRIVNKNKESKILQFINGVRSVKSIKKTNVDMNYFKNIMVD